MKLILIFIVCLFFVSQSYALSDTCSWCVTKNQKVIAELKELSEKPPVGQLKLIRSKGLCVKVVGSGVSTSGGGEFTWGQIEKPAGDWSDVTLQRRVYAVTFCANEKPVAKNCPTIALASSATQVQLLAEFLHYRQIEQDSSWCALSKALWTRTATPNEISALQDKQWDIYRTLWETRKSLNLSDEDRAMVYGTLINLARLRKWYDPSGDEYVKQQKIQNELLKITAAIEKKEKRRKLLK